MNDQKIKPEDAVKFFVSLASAGVGFVVLLQARFSWEPVFVRKPSLPSVWIFASLVCFGVCLVQAGLFYSAAMTTDQREPWVRRQALRCGTWCASGVLLLLLGALWYFASPPLPPPRRGGGELGKSSKARPVEVAKFSLAVPPEAFNSGGVQVGSLPT